MALSLRRTETPTDAEAFVFFEGFPDATALTQDLNRIFGAEGWVGVSDADAASVLEAATLKTPFAIITVTEGDAHRTERAVDLIRTARKRGLSVLLIVGELGAQEMHRLIRSGVSDFVPYPDPPGALAETVDRMRVAASVPESASGLGLSGTLDGRRLGTLLTIYGVAGGVGASTLAVNLAWEIANQTRRSGRKTVLLDFNFQYGSVATYLDVPRREAVYELVSDASTVDQTGLTQALSGYRDLLQVLTAPRDALPLDIVSPTDIAAIIGLARESFDFVLIDLPLALMGWSEQVYTASDQFLAVMEPDMRSTQNMFRFLRSLKSEDMSLDRLRFVLNRAPGLTDISGKARVRRLSNSLGIDFSHQLPNGGTHVRNACDQGTPLSEVARSNPLRREIARIATQIVGTEVPSAETRRPAG